MPIVVSVLLPFVSQCDADPGVHGMLTRTRPLKSIILSAASDSGCSAADEVGQPVSQLHTHTNPHPINRRYLWEPINLPSKRLSQRALESHQVQLALDSFYNGPRAGQPQDLNRGISEH